MSRHLLIAGTGRAGTSFLVRYLDHLGLDTHLSRAGAKPLWDNAANAGLEDLPGPNPSELPYVIKSPWTFQVIHDALADGRIGIDAAVIPLRDLTEAACSRSIIEMQAVRQQLSWLGELDRTWECYGHTPGGVIYSLNPVDQARLLAVGLHQLLDALVQADVPVVLLSFPRLIEDADYLYRKLAPVLPDSCSPEAARNAHAAVADPAKVRVGAEMKQVNPAEVSGMRLDGPGPMRLERAVLTRRLAETRHQLETTRTRLDEARAFAQATVAARASDATGLRDLETRLSETTEARDQALDRARRAEEAVQAMQRAIDAERRVNDMELAALRDRVAALGSGWFGRWLSGWTGRGWRQPAE